MKNSATVNLCGYLGDDIEIKESKKGKKYGILYLAINVYSKKPDTEERIQKTNWYKVHIWNQSLLSKPENLKKGAKALIVGDLRSFIKTIRDANGSDIGNYPILTINVRRKSGITILKKEILTNKQKDSTAA